MILLLINGILERIWVVGLELDLLTSTNVEPVEMR